MTTELKKQFFDTFGIEPKTETNFLCVYDNGPEIRNCQKPRSECENCSDFLKRTVYPQITDRHYLELICILNDYTGIDVRAIKIEELKEELLKHCIELIEYELYNDDDIDNFKHQVQAIFKGER